MVECEGRGGVRGSWWNARDVLIGFIIHVGKFRKNDKKKRIYL